MQELFDAAWSILNIEITFEGLTFKAWHPAAFCLIITIVFKLLTMGGANNE